MKLTRYAPGVIFNAEEHTYHLNGKQLNGVTRLIKRRIGQKMPEEFTGEAREDGLHVHQAVERWIDTGVMDSIHPGAQWVKSILEKTWTNNQCRSEVLVSDMEQYASSVDIMCRDIGGQITLYDMKRTFNRMYVTWQLSIYKYFIEKIDPTAKVDKGYCLAIREKSVYPVFFFSPVEVEELLYVYSKNIKKLN